MGGFLRKRKIARIFAAIEIEIGKMQAVIFEHVHGARTPTPLKKFSLRVLPGKSPEEIAIKLHELIFSIIKIFGRVPEKLAVAIYPPLADYALLEWKTSSFRNLKSLNSENLRRIFEDLKKQNTDSNYLSKSYLLEPLVNGYRLQNGARHTGKIKEISFRTLCLNFSKKDGTHFFELEKSLGGIPIEFVPAILPQSAALAKALGVNDAFLIDVAEKATVLTLIREGKIANINIFFSGAETIRSELGEILSSQDALSVQRQYADTLLETRPEGRLEQALIKGLERWYVDFSDSLNSFYVSGPLPELVFLSGESVIIPKLREFVQKGDWIKKMSHVKTPSVRLFEGRSVFGGDTLGGFINGPQDAAIASLIFYLIQKNF